jgi:hypothetical protein
MTNKLDRTNIILTGLLLACLLIYSCNRDKKNNESLLKENIQTSPLDTILGEKILNAETGEKRKDNFESLLNMKKQVFQIESSLYNIKQIDANHFILSQKKDYAEARNFNILIKTDDSIVKSYYVTNDFHISDIKQDSGNWILLLSDFYQTNTYWKSKQQIKIIKLDSDFNQVWIFSKNSSTPLSGQSLKVNTDNYTFDIEVITGCHICFSLARLVLTKDGKFIDVKSIGNQNSQELSDAELNSIFYDK